MNALPSYVARRASGFRLLLLLLLPTAAEAINCRITVTPVNFGTYVPLTPTHVDARGQVRVRCVAQPGSFVIIMGPGLSGNQAARTMSAGGGDVLNYNLFRDAAYSQIWGDGTPPTFTVTGVRPGTGPPSIFVYPIFGRSFSGQTPNPGAYSDNLLVTILF